ncbi:MAG: hypothetical protein K5985_05890 [Lachnospiraceae bacterium]|nr:hypothetical protein [Lachnospiraceae bacterium]
MEERKGIVKNAVRFLSALAVCGALWGLMPGAARADGPTMITSSTKEWSGEIVNLAGIDVTIEGDVQVDGDTAIRLTDDSVGGSVRVTVSGAVDAADGATLTLGEGVTLKAAGMNIGNAGSGTLTVEGPGTLNVDDGTICGNVILKGATVVVKEGGGTLDADVPDADKQGVKGDVTVDSGRVSITGGRGTYNDNTGIGGPGIKGNLTVYGGEVDVAGGALPSDSSLTGPGGNGVAGNVTFKGGKLTITGGAGKGEGQADGIAIAESGKLTNDFAGRGWTDIAGTGAGTEIGTGTNQDLESNYEKVEFQSPKHAITVSESAKGRVTLSNSAGECVGVYVTLTAVPDNDCKLAGLTVTAADGTDVPIRDGSEWNTNTYVFTMPDQAVTVAASFKENNSFLGSGTSDDPYQIWDQADWQLLADKVRNGNEFETLKP